MSLESEFERLNPPADTPLRTFTVSSKEVERLAFSPDGAYLAVPEERSAGIALWDIQTEQKIRTISMPGGTRSFVFSPDGRLIWVASNEGSIVAYRVADGHSVLSLVSSDLDGFSPSSLVTCAAGKRLAAVRMNGEIAKSGGYVQIWQLDTAEEICRWPVHGSGHWAVHVTLSADGMTCALADGWGDIVLRDVASGDVVQTLAPPQLSGLSWIGVQFAPDGRTMIAIDERTPYREDWSLYDIGGFIGEIHIWECKTGQLRHTFELPEHRVPSFSLSNHHLLLAVVCQNWKSTVRLWNWDTSTLIQTIAVPVRYTPASVAFSPDGKTLAVGHESGKVTFWRVV